MMQIPQKLTTPQEKELIAKVKEKGGKTAALEDEQAMEELAEDEYTLVVNSDPDGQHGARVPFNFPGLQQEIEANPDDAIKRHAAFFNRKFEIQKKQEEITCAINQQGDRITSAAAAGQYDRIVDNVRHEVSPFQRFTTCPFVLGHLPDLEGSGECACPSVAS